MTPLALAVLATFVAPAACTVGLAALLLVREAWPTERTVALTVQAGLWASLVASGAAAALSLGGPPETGVSLGSWFAVGDYEVPLLFVVDRLALAFSALAALLTAVVGVFSRTYLHREPGFARFFLLLGMFAAGAQLVAFAGALDLLFAGWELLGLSSALFVGFFHERSEPVRSSVRVFTTYRVCDIGFFLAIGAFHELLGTTRLSALADAASLPAFDRNLVAGLFLLAALGKSAQLPFSTWLPRAMEGPTPSSALFYGGVSVHTGLFLMLRVHPLLDAAPVVEALGVVVGVATALFAGAVARVQTDAKGTLAFATLAQTGLILAEISAGWTTLALVHLVFHACLRVAQYLRAPNTLHDAHARGHGPRAGAPFPWLPAAWQARVWADAVHWFRLDERLDHLTRPVLAAARWLDRADRTTRGQETR